MKLLAGLTALVGGSALMIGAFLLLPLIFLSSINTLAEQANFALYIPHTMWSYVASYGLFLCIGRG